MALPSRLPAVDATCSRTLRDRQNEPSLSAQRRDPCGESCRWFQRHARPRPLSLHGYRCLRHCINGSRRKLGLLASNTHGPDSRLHHGGYHWPSCVESERLISGPCHDRPGGSIPDIGEY